MVLLLNKQKIATLTDLCIHKLKKKIGWVIFDSLEISLYVI